MALPLRTSILALCAACVLAGGCVSGKTYRTQLRAPDACAASAQSTESCATDALHTLEGAAPGAPPVLLGFVEFDDQGYLREPQFKNGLMREVRRIGEQRPLLVVVFAHGWKHNADASDGNVKAFADMLVRLSRADAAMCAGLRCAERQTIGIYLGWRGLSNRAEPFKEMTFWARKERAERVGRDGAAEVFAELAKIKAHNVTKNCPNDNRLIVTGHSFGGALVYEGVRQNLMRDSANMIKGTVYRNTANLVVLVNPAFEAARFQAFHRRGHDELNIKAGQHPVLAVFTSLGDTATERAFPFGRTLGTLGSDYTTDEQKEQDRTALGHYKDYRTHKLTAAAAPDEDIHSEAEQYEDFAFGRRDDWTAGGATLTRLAPADSGSQRFIPYVVASVEEGLVGNHNDIWGEAFTNFLFRYVAVQSYRGDRARCRKPAAAAVAGEATEVDVEPDDAAEE